MKCRECVEFLMAYLEGELPSEQCASFEVHLEKCPPCKRYLESYKRTIELEKALGRETTSKPPCDVPEQLVKAILAARNDDNSSSPPQP